MLGTCACSIAKHAKLPGKSPLKLQPQVLHQTSHPRSKGRNKAVIPEASHGGEVSLVHQFDPANPSSQLIAKLA